MKKKVTYSKDAHLHIRVDKNDLKRWKERARQWEIPLTVYAIRALNHMDRFGEKAKA